MSDHPSQHVRSATNAGIEFTITDLEIATSLMHLALTTVDSELAFRTYNHAVRALTETQQLLTRITPEPEQQTRLNDAIAVLEARLAAFRARRM